MRLAALHLIVTHLLTSPGIYSGLHPLGAPRPPTPTCLPTCTLFCPLAPALQPYSDGLLVQLCLSPQAAQGLRKHPLLEALLPLARWVGGDS